MQGPLDRHSFDVACPGCKIKNPKTLGWLKAHNQFICEGCGKNIDIDKSRFTAGVDQLDKAFRNLTKTIRDLKDAQAAARQIIRERVEQKAKPLP
jgi:transposase-like protein